MNDRFGGFAAVACQPGIAQNDVFRSLETP